jgi:hypothetical protein
MTRKNIIARMVSSNNKIVSSRFFEQSQFEQFTMSPSKAQCVKDKHKSTFQNFPRKLQGPLNISKPEIYCNDVTSLCFQCRIKTHCSYFFCCWFYFTFWQYLLNIRLCGVMNRLIFLTKYYVGLINEFCQQIYI